MKKTASTHQSLCEVWFLFGVIQTYIINYQYSNMINSLSLIYVEFIWRFVLSYQFSNRTLILSFCSSIQSLYLFPQQISRIWTFPETLIENWKSSKTKTFLPDSYDSWILKININFYKKIDKLYLAHNWQLESIMTKQVSPKNYEPIDKT